METEFSSFQNSYNLLSVPQSSRKRILVVDDCVDGAESMAILLRFQGYEVVTAHNGPDALRAAQLNRPNVALLDIAMPGMSGYEVAQQLRAMFHHQIGLIALTAYGSSEDRRNTYEAGFDYHLVKPADFETLEQTLRQLLS